MSFKRILFFLAGVIFFPLFATAQNLELKNNFFYIDNEKFFVKGIGFEVGATPGELPWEHTFNADLLNFDIQRILSGGFNTIRTWAPLTDQELELIQDYDIKIIMGIWIDPHADFSDPQFVTNAVNIVEDVLSYSKNYDNIIAYLIMNEPSPETIANSGYDETVALWTELIEIIHSEHPNRPVSIANTSNGTYIDPAIFDFSAYNVYIYNPVTVNFLNGYRDFVSFIQQLNVPEKPLIITEYGLSVSPNGPGNWGYGGNTLAEQQEGDLFMYKSLVDGGASGSCIFNYSDGWWKAGNQYVHNDNAEEWFGLVEYSDLSDQYGQTRPVWDAIKTFQTAIITQPRSSDLYLHKVPFEIFLNDTINHIQIYVDNELIYQLQPNNNYVLDTLEFAVQGMKDVLLVINCYDSFNNLVKSEEKNILITSQEVTLPTIEISIMNDNFWQNGFVDVNYQINRESSFNDDSKLDYIFYPHIGFDYGQSFIYTMPNDQQFSFATQHSISSNVDVFTIGAAFNITYNNFKKRIVSQQVFSRINEISNSVHNEVLTISTPKIFPNPVRNYFKVKYDVPSTTSYFNYTIYNTMGIIVKQNDKVGINQSINISSLNPGIYYIETEIEDYSVPFVQKIIKL